MRLNARFVCFLAKLILARLIVIGCSLFGLMVHKSVVSDMTDKTDDKFLSLNLL